MKKIQVKINGEWEEASNVSLSIKGIGTKYEIFSPDGQIPEEFVLEDIMLINETEDECKDSSIDELSEYPDGHWESRDGRLATTLEQKTSLLLQMYQDLAEVLNNK